MPSLKDLRTRIGSVKSTRKITSAMKMVAASKLRRAQEQAQAGQPYAERMAAILGRLAAGIVPGPESPRLLIGTGSQDRHLLVVVSSDRGLAGGFNSQIVREARRTAQRLESEGRTVRFLAVGRKARDLLRRLYGDRVIDSFVELGRPRLGFADASRVAERMLALFEAEGQFDVVHLVYNRFKSVVAQVPTVQQVIPFSLPTGDLTKSDGAVYEFEPSEDEILAQLLPRNLSVQVFRALLDSAAGEQAARMQAMDNATRNAGDMIARLTLNYNRARQAYITKELIEIISGAEAV